LKIEGRRLKIEDRRLKIAPSRVRRPSILYPLSSILDIPRSLLLILVICLLAAPTRQAQQQNPQEKEGKAKTPPISSHVILITISGLRSDFVTGAESGRLNIPTIQALRSRGSYAIGIESVFPTQTLPAHASMITGSPPSDHGVTSDYSFDQKSASQSKGPRKSTPTRACSKPISA